MASSNIEMYNHWLAKKNQLQLSQEEAKIQSEQVRISVLLCCMNGVF